MKILVVDDSITMRRIITKALNSAGWDDVVEANNGGAALNMLDGVDLILTDWNMPAMDGLTFSTTVRQNPAYADVPIIMVTTESTKDAVITALKIGVNDYIVKPFTPLTLVEKINAIMDLN